MTPAIVDITKLSRSDLIDQLILWGYGTSCLTRATDKWRECYSDQALRAALERIQLIAELEGLGMDGEPGTPANWRDVWTIEELKSALAGLNDDPFPEIDAMAFAIEKAERALSLGQMMLCGNDYTDGRGDHVHTVFYHPLKTCRTVLSQIEKARGATNARR